MGKGKYLKKQKLSTGKKIGRVVLIILLVILLLVGAVFGFIWSKLDKIIYDDGTLNDTVPETVATEPLNEIPATVVDSTVDPTDFVDSTEPEETIFAKTDVDVSDLVMETAPNYSQGELFKDKDVMNILLVGSDERTRGYVAASRGDLNILISINKAEKTVKLVSFSRGIAIKMLDGQNKGKYAWLTNAHAYAGHEAVLEAMSDAFKIELDRYVRVNFHTAMSIVYEIGGIDIELTEAEAKHLNRTKGFSLVPGMNNLDGYRAIAFARLRGLDDDWGRIVRQRKVILAVVEKLKGSSFKELNDLCDLFLPLIQTNLTKIEIAELILYAPKFLESEFDQMTIPLENSYSGMNVYPEGGGWALDYEKNNAALHEFLFGTAVQE